MSQYPDLLNEIAYPLEDGVDQLLESNGKIFIRANANQVVVTFKHQNDTNTTYATLATVPANTGLVLDTVFPTKNGKIKVTGGSAFIVVFRD
jgi:hypothetical protein